MWSHGLRLYVAFSTSNAPFKFKFGAPRRPPGQLSGFGMRSDRTRSVEAKGSHGEPELAVYRRVNGRDHNTLLMRRILLFTLDRSGTAQSCVGSSALLNISWGERKQPGSWLRGREFDSSEFR